MKFPSPEHGSEMLVPGKYLLTMSYTLGLPVIDCLTALRVSQS